MDRSHRYLPRSAFIAELLNIYCLVSLTLCTAVIVFTWSCFAAGISINTYNLIIPILMIGFLTVYNSDFGRPFAAIIPGIFVLITLIACAKVESFIADTSWDGMTYHNVSIIALNLGWNPLKHYDVVSWLNDAYPGKRWLSNQIVHHGLWSNSYPKASWILGSVISSAFKSLNASKWLQPFLCIASIAATCRVLLLAGSTPITSIAIAVAAGLSPIVICQLDSNYNDGLLGSSLLIQMSLSSAWYLYRRGSDLVSAICAACISSNLKYTGLVYSLIFAASVLVVAWISRRFIKKEILIILGGCLIFTAASAPTYAYNILSHHSIFYPIGTVDVMRPQESEEFLGQDRWSKFFESTFIEPPGSRYTPNQHVHVPRLADYHAVVLNTDLRMGGMGSLFGWELMLSLVLLIIAVASSGQKNYRDPRFIISLVMLACTLISTICNPEFWWARYVPQLWLAPIIIAFACGLVGMARLSIIILLLAGCGSTVTLGGFLMHQISVMKQQRAVLDAGKAAGYLSIRNDQSGRRAWFVMAHQFRTEGIAMKLAAPSEACSQPWAMAKICRLAP